MLVTYEVFERVVESSAYDFYNRYHFLSSCSIHP